MNNLHEVIKEAQMVKVRWHWETKPRQEVLYSKLLSSLEEAQREIERLNTALHTHKSYDLTVSELIEENRKLHTEHTAMKESQELYKDVVESLYQIIQRGDLTSFDLTQADEVLSTLSKEEQTDGI